MSELTRAMHTPGPWQVGDTWAGVTRFVERLGQQPGYVAEARGSSPEERDANARLIAAAPELLAALEVVRRSAAWSNLSLETQSLICAAIAKAEGR